LFELIREEERGGYGLIDYGVVMIVGCGEAVILKLKPKEVMMRQGQSRVVI
jgi:hypothetical protein